MLSDEQLLEHISDEQLRMFKNYASIAPSWRKKESIACDLYFPILLALSELKIDMYDSGNFRMRADDWNFGKQPGKPSIIRNSFRNRRRTVLGRLSDCFQKVPQKRKAHLYNIILFHNIF